MMFRRKYLTLFERTSFCPSLQNKRKKSMIITLNILFSKAIVSQKKYFLVSLHLIIRALHAAALLVPYESLAISTSIRYG